MFRTHVSLLVAGALLLAGCFTNPVTGRKSLVLLTPEQELALGAQSFADVQKTEAVSQDPALNERVRRVGNRIAQAVGSDMPGAQWEFTVFDSPEANAFALPGGKVGVYTGLLQLATSDDELATVIGHEIGHVIGRHGAERVSEATVMSGLGELGAMLAQNYTNNPQALQAYKLAYGVVGNAAVILPHSRRAETEADRMGIIYAARAGYDPRAAITFWQKMLAQKGPGGGGLLEKWMSTHPPGEDRIAALQALMPEVLPIYQQNRGRL